MVRLLTKIYVLLLLASFLLSNVAAASGLAFCFADDGHVEIEYTSEEGCTDSYVIGNGKSDKEIFFGSVPTKSHCGPCNDLELTQSETTFAKRLLKEDVSFSDFSQMDTARHFPGTSARLVLSNFAPQPPPRISQTVLNQRTVVLLI